jgi:hypothetical protein
VVVREQSGNYVPPLQYVILTANGGVTGTFRGAVSSYGYLHPTLTYDANDDKARPPCASSCQLSSAIVAKNGPIARGGATMEGRLCAGC